MLIFLTAELAIWIAITLFHPRLGTELIWTFFHSKTALSIWINQGHSVYAAASIGSAIGGLSVISQWLIAYHQFDPSSWIGRLLKRRFASDPPVTHWAYRLGYFSLPIAAIVTAIAFSLAVAKYFGMKKWPVLLILLATSTIENFFYGGALSLVNRIPVFSRNLVSVTLGVFLLTFLVVVAIKKIQSAKIVPIPATLSEPES